MAVYRKSEGNNNENEESVDVVKSFSFQDKKLISKNINMDSDSDNESIKSNESDAFLNKNMKRHKLYGLVRPIDDYLYRSEKFNSLSLYEFSCKVYRDKRKENENISDHGFMKEHPLHLTHVLRTRKYEAVPIINGKKLKLLSNNSNLEEKDENALIALVLYKSFRNALLDLKEMNESWYEAYKSWIPSPEIKQLITNNFDLDVARKRSGEIQRMQKLDTIDNDSDSSQSISDNERNNHDNEDGFHLEDFIDCITYNSDYYNLAFDEFQNDDNDPVRFPKSTPYSDKITGSIKKLMETIYFVEM